MLVAAVAAGSRDAKREEEMASQQAVIYARVSSREQREEGYSIEAQVRLLRDAAIKNDFVVAMEFIEIESAKEAGRPIFNEMVKFFKKNRACRVLLVEKTDRLYRNKRDPLVIDDLEIAVHFVKEGDIVSKDAKSQVKFMHDIRIAMARNYSENLREEVKKGMAEKAAQGMFPGHAPFGYKNNKAARCIDVHPEKSRIVRRLYELYASGRYSVATVGKAIKKETGIYICKANAHRILTNPFYIGKFEWGKQVYDGNHERLISAEQFSDVQSILNGFNKPKYGTQDIPFRGVLHCHLCGCAITGERKKGKYVYYRCTCGRGECQLPRFREQEITAGCGELLKGLRIPEDVAQSIVAALENEQGQTQKSVAAERTRLQRALTILRTRQDKALVAKLDGEISADFWQRNQTEWQEEELTLSSQIENLKDGEIDDRIIDLKRTLELAQKAYSLYVTRKPQEQAELMKSILLNCTIDGEVFILHIEGHLI